MPPVAGQRSEVKNQKNCETPHNTMRYQPPVFRPPSEADSYILQITYGCSHNRCTFCAMYRTKTFRARPFSEIKEDILEAARVDSQIRRVFLADGDAMVLSTPKLLEILKLLNENFKSLERVAIYADAHGILRKTAEELAALREHKLSIVYLGLESGSDKVLSAINKGITATEMCDAITKARSAQIQTSVIALLGIGGVSDSAEHARETARVVSQMSPDYFSALTLTLVEGTELFDSERNGTFQALSPEASLQELGEMLAQIQPTTPIIFRTNHASNYVTLRGTLPQDREAMLSKIHLALKNKALKPEWMRGL